MTEPNARPLRTAHKDLTRTLIVGAALDLLRSQKLETLTVAAVAARAGVTERTIYRHFETREDLCAALWPALCKRLNPSPRSPATGAELSAETARAFAGFDRDAGPVQALAFSAAGRAIGADPARLVALRACVRDARPDLEEPALTRLAAVVTLLNSAHAWAAMQVHWGLDGRDAGRAASEATARLLGLDRRELDRRELDHRELDHRELDRGDRLRPAPRRTPRRPS